MSQFWCVQIRQVAEKLLFARQSSCVNGTGYDTLVAILMRQNDFYFTCKESLQNRIFTISLESFILVAQKCGSEAVKGLSKFCSEDFYIWLILYNFYLWSQMPNLLCDVVLTLTKALVATAGGRHWAIWWDQPPRHPVRKWLCTQLGFPFSCFIKWITIYALFTSYYCTKYIDNYSNTASGIPTCLGLLYH